MNDIEKIKEEINFSYWNFNSKTCARFIVASAENRERNTKIMVTNRVSRINYLNLEIFNDEIDEGFKYWLKFNYQNTGMDEGLLCICGMKLCKECFYVRRFNSISNVWYAMRIGSYCINQIDKYHGTKTTNDALKKCKCGNRKNIKQELCKKCIINKEMIETSMKAMKILETKLIKSPNNTFYIDLKKQYYRKGFLSDKQIECIYK